MSLLGFSFGFGARDDGLGNALENTNQQIGSIERNMGKLSNASQQAQKVFMGAINTLQLNNISGALNKIAGDDTLKLTTSLEATFNAMRNEAAGAIAQISLTTAEYNKNMSKATSLAHSMNVGVGQVAQAMTAQARASASVNAVLKEMGISTKELVRIQGATGQSADDLLANIRNLTDSYSFSTKEAAAFLDQFTKVAKGTRTADTAFGDLSKTLNTLDDALASDTNRS